MPGYWDMLARSPTATDIFAMASQARASRDAAEARARAEDRQLQRDTLADDQMRFDRSMRVKEHEQRRADYETRMAEAQQKKEAEASAILDKNTAAAAQAFSQMSPERQQQALPYMENLAKAGTIRPDWNAGTAVPVQSAIQGIEQPKQPGPTGDMIEYAAAKNDPGLARYLERQARAKATQVNVGHSELAGGPKGKFQEDIASGEELLADIADLKALATPEGADRPDYSQFLGLRNKAKNFTLNAIADMSPESLDPDTLNQLGLAREFREGADQIYLKAKKNITGVSAGQAELREIRGTVLNSDLNSPEFSASIDKLERVTARNNDIKRRLLDEGIDLKSEAGRQRFSSEIQKARQAEGGQTAAPVSPSLAPLAGKQVSSKKDAIRALIEQGILAPDAAGVLDEVAR